MDSQNTYRTYMDTARNENDRKEDHLVFMIDSSKINDENIASTISDYFAYKEENKFWRVELGFTIQNDADYDCFFKYFVDVPENTPDKSIGSAFSIKLKEAFRHCIIRFQTKYEQNETINELLLHNYLLFMSLLEEPLHKKGGIKFYINKDYSKESVKDEDADYFRYLTYLQGSKPDIIRSVMLNGKQIVYKEHNIGKIIPAMRLDSNFLEFVRSPIDSSTWVKICSSEDIKLESFSDGTNEKKYWYLLQACKKYLFDDFEDNTSTAYTELRKRLFSSEAFYRDHIASMPFLAVLMFAQYDYYWRDDIFFDFKIKTDKNPNLVRPRMHDLIVSLQPHQKYDFFSAYRNQIEEDNYSDMKSLVKDFEAPVLCRCLEKKLLEKDDIREMIDQNCRIEVKISPQKNEHREIFECSIFEQPQGGKTGKNNVKKKLNDEQTSKIKHHVSEFTKNMLVPHRIVIQELFEAQTIAEGLLQMIENAVYHSHNGLMSMRIRNYKCDEDNKKAKADTEYLREQYPDYFIEERKNRFYVEIKLSDINSKTLTEKFEENVRSYTEPPKDWLEEFSGFLAEYKKLKREKIVFQPFFDAENTVIDEPDNSKKALSTIMRKYYNIQGTSIHHFGLQIFDSVVTSKKGMFSVSGHGACYSESAFGKYKPQERHLNRGIKGASYRILLPFVSNLYVGGNVAQSMDDTELIYGEQCKSQPVVIDWDETGIRQEIEKYKNLPEKSPKKKEECISAISELIMTQVNKSDMYLVFDFLRDHVPEEVYLELVIKGLLTSVLKMEKMEKKCPVAIINLSSHSFLESIRLIALLYNKHGEAVEVLKKVQIYICGREIGEEMLFSGGRMSDNAARLIRAVMTQGMMSEYLEIANILLKRPDEEI